MCLFIYIYYIHTEILTQANLMLQHTGCIYTKLSISIHFSPMTQTSGAIQPHISGFSPEDENNRLLLTMETSSVIVISISISISMSYQT